MWNATYVYFSEPNEHHDPFRKWKILLTRVKYLIRTPQNRSLYEIEWLKIASSQVHSVLD